GEGRFQGDDLSASMEAGSASAEAEDASAEAQRFDRGSSDRTWLASPEAEPQRASCAHLRSWEPSE
ncbi:hypothetical protein FB107DRAFT_224274, partial [Schizophyllum commune]